jgi:hypothetical protein
MRVFLEISFAPADDKSRKRGPGDSFGTEQMRLISLKIHMILRIGIKQEPTNPLNISLHHHIGLDRISQYLEHVLAGDFYFGGLLL